MRLVVFFALCLLTLCSACDLMLPEGSAQPQYCAIEAEWELGYYADDGRFIVPVDTTACL